MKLLPIKIPEGSSVNDAFDSCNEIFKKGFLTKENRPMLKGCDIYVPIYFHSDKKSEVFWHISSLSPKEVLRPNILPCNNDIASDICDENCWTENEAEQMKDLSIRTKCLYRASRIAWIKEVIELYNNNDSRVQYWEKMNSNKKIRLYLRYSEDENDFLVVFEGKGIGNVVFITAFPVFFMNAKKDYTNDYLAYKNRQS